MQSKYNTKYSHYQVGRLPHHSNIETYFKAHYAPSKSVLELGAGTGIGTKALSAYFRQVIAVEPVSEMLEVCKASSENDNVFCINSDVESLDISQLQFDYLICFQATHWFYETPIYGALHEKAEQPVIDICSFITFPNQQPFFDELAKSHTVEQSNRGTKYPFDVAQADSYQTCISVEHAAHQLCSRSWVDHTCFPQIQTKIAEHFGNEDVLVDVETRIHKIA